MISSNGERATIELDMCQGSVVLLGVRPLLACDVAVKMVRMTAVFDTVGS